MAIKNANIMYLQSNILWVLWKLKIIKDYYATWDGWEIATGDENE